MTQKQTKTINNLLSVLVANAERDMRKRCRDVIYDAAKADKRPAMRTRLEGLAMQLEEMPLSVKT